MKKASDKLIAEVTLALPRWQKLKLTDLARTYTRALHVRTLEVSTEESVDLTNSQIPEYCEFSAAIPDLNGRSDLVSKSEIIVGFLCLILVWGALIAALAVWFPKATPRISHDRSSWSQSIHR